MYINFTEKISCSAIFHIKIKQHNSTSHYSQTQKHSGSPYYTLMLILVSSRGNLLLLIAIP